MKNIGKIFDLEDRQVIAIKYYNNDEDKSPYEIHLLFDVDEGIRGEMRFGFSTKDMRDKGFDQLESNKVEDAINEVINKFDSYEEGYDPDEDDGC